MASCQWRRPGQARDVQSTGRADPNPHSQRPPCLDTCLRPGSGAVLIGAVFRDRSPVEKSYGSRSSSSVDTALRSSPWTAGLRDDISCSATPDGDPRPAACSGAERGEGTGRGATPSRTRTPGTASTSRPWWLPTVRSIWPRRSMRVRWPAMDRASRPKKRWYKATATTTTPSTTMTINSTTPVPPQLSPDPDERRAAHGPLTLPVTMVDGRGEGRPEGNRSSAPGSVSTARV